MEWKIMAHFAYTPFASTDTDDYVKITMNYYKDEKQATILTKGVETKIKSDDILHVVGHGHNFEGDRMDASLSGKPSITANDLSKEISSFISESHKLVMLDCCFAMGQYLGKKWWEGKSGDFLGRIVVKALAQNSHSQIIVGGSVNATTSPKAALAQTPIGYDIGTKMTANDQTRKAFSGQSRDVGVSGETALVVPRLLFFLNGAGDWVDANGQPSAPPKPLW